MKRKIIGIMLLSASLILSMAACGKKEEKLLDASKLTEKLVSPESETQTTQEPAIESEESVDDRKDNSFRDFVGDYVFTSGVGGWSANVTINGDGSFSGMFYDINMGGNDVDSEYPNGTVYRCDFSGQFSKLIKKDEFTYTCSLEEITQEEETGKETINQEEGMRYISSDPYGFEDAKDFEFYLPGKSIADCDSEFLSCTSLMYSQPYPDTLLHKAFHNLSAKYGFEEEIDYTGGVEAEYPSSLPLDGYELAGSYTNENLGIVMNISVYTNYEEGDEACGNISWDIPESVDIWNDEATFLPSDNGFDVTPESFGRYKIIVTDNTSEKVVIHLYDSSGHDCGEYVMTQHYVS